MTASDSGVDEKPRLNRRERRERKRAVIKQLLDGPPRPPVCGQAKAAARKRQANAQSSKEPKVPKKGNTKEKKAARELQAATGQPYCVCLAEVRALAQQARSSGGEQ
ncbi:hypothetical protein [Streptomyces sp. NPDC005385]|uniref:hypothetical protein n=1 Tax=Streptomyces sp. NPDC005385 TaxID=3157039 RepID=UPI0033BAAFF7